ncbi:MAG: hypothetical protein WB709_03770 [Solirubrobacteraceae bacterium]
MGEGVRYAGAEVRRRDRRGVIVQVFSSTYAAMTDFDYRVLWDTGERTDESARDLEPDG